MQRWFRRRQAALPEFVQAYLHAEMPARSLPWRAVPYSVLDIETTGLEVGSDALLAIGLIEIEEGQVRLDRRWETLVRPPAHAPLRPDAVAVTGLLRGDTAGAPPLDAVLPELLSRLGGRVLVVHMAEVDVAFLNRALRQQYGIGLRGPVLDTARLALALHGDERFLGGNGQEPALQLAALCERLGLPTYTAHDALGDAITTAQLFLAQATALEAHGRATLAALVRAGGVVR
jgi:DNA polymerase III subunit epsilon